MKNPPAPRTGSDDATEAGWSAKVVSRIGEVEASAWDALAGDDNPFVSHAFLAALEESGAVGGKSGWYPRHLLVEDAAGRLVGAAPAYLKTHSYGEYVFDHGWAEAYESAGGRYYPKLQVCVPFTPVPGPRLLVRAGPEAAHLRAAMPEILSRAATQLEATSVHVTFCRDEELAALEAGAYLHRLGIQYHWENRGYGSFDDFLGQLASRKRKAIRKERAEVARQGLAIEILSGDDLKTRHWDAFFRFYMDTSSRKWGQAYLNREFFDRIGASLKARIALVMVRHDGRAVAGALNLIGRSALYGRNWGALAEYPFLHFEACYYQAIEFAIARGLARVEAGAQGEHKIQRGYLPVVVHSGHWIADPRLARAVGDFLARERPQVRHHMQALAETLSPYRKGGEA